jgi:hypothetical protein
VAGSAFLITISREQFCCRNGNRCTSRSRNGVSAMYSMPRRRMSSNISGAPRPSSA